MLATVSVILLTAASCNPARLESGGAYAPPGQVADLQFYQVDLAFDLARTGVHGVLKFERDNRNALWALSPEIKHTLDRIRPDVVKAESDYFKARATYLSNPVPAGLDPLRTASAKMRQLSATTATVIPASR